MKRLMSVLLMILILFSADIGMSEGNADAKELKLLFTHDIHSFYGISKTLEDGEIHEHGGAARLKTLIDENRDENTLYLDAGDFSIGTLIQTGFTTDAFELRLLGSIGCDVTTFGNHEFDYTANGTASMLRAALNSGDALPRIVQSNVVYGSLMSGIERDFSDALTEYGAEPYTIIKRNGIKVGIFGLLGIDSIACAPNSGLSFQNYIEAASKIVPMMRENGADVVVCLSHSGTDGDGKNGEDIELAKSVPGIDVIISGHSHSVYYEPVIVGHTIIASTGEYLSNLGSMTLSVSADGVECTDYRMIRCDENVAEDPELAAEYDTFMQSIRDTYLADENCDYDDVIAHCGFDFMPLNEMYATHQEYPLGNLIADSYIYEAGMNGINDIDVALVGLGTIRGSIFKGDITVSDAFEICSLGVGTDESAGHPLVSAYLTGKELKLLVELDASLGPLVSSIKMSYSGLRYTFNTKRCLLDRAFEIRLTHPGGVEETIEDDKLYKVCCNLYAADMLGMLNGLTKGILAIVPKDADGNPVRDLSACAMKNKDGKEIKEWIAFKDYLSSFPGNTIPSSYAAPEGRKLKISKGGLSIFENAGLMTKVAVIQFVFIIALVAVLILTRKKRKDRHLRRKEARRQKRAAS